MKTLFLVIALMSLSLPAMARGKTTAVTVQDEEAKEQQKPKQPQDRDKIRGARDIQPRGTEIDGTEAGVDISTIKAQQPDGSPFTRKSGGSLIRPEPTKFTGKPAKDSRDAREGGR